MGEIAARLADVVIVSDDNPRSEVADEIRAAILAAAPGARDIGDRRAAIAEACAMLQEGDLLVVAGKGHETGQIIAGRTLPFSDHEAVRAALEELEHGAEAATDRGASSMTDAVLWSGLGLVAPLEARVGGKLAAGVGGVSIDTRTLEAGDLFFAIKGENSDGHDYVAAAFEKGAAACVVNEAHADALQGRGSLFIVREVLPALERLARAARARTSAQIVAVTGSVGKTGTKEALRLVFAAAGATHASVASYNNHWGVPLTLARMPRDSRFGVFEIGINHQGEITPLVAMVRPHVALVTSVAPVHLEYFELDRGHRASQVGNFFRPRTRGHCDHRS